MNSKIKKILVLTLLSLSLFLSVPAGSNAAGLNVCGGQTANYTAYQAWLINPLNQALEKSNKSEYDRQLQAKEKEYGICRASDAFRGLARITNFLFSYIALFAILRIAFIGWAMMQVMGNEEGIKTQKTHLYNALYGFVMVLAAYLVLNYVYTILGVDGAFTFPFNPF